MLKRLHDTAGQDAALALSQMDSLAPFTYGLGYSAPARGGWTIVHVGMLLPESHQVFVCAQSCLRDVVLPAAELDDSSRLSTISVDEDSVLEGNCEEITIEGVAHILEGLPALPKALLLFTSCVHHFLGTDMKIVFGELNTRFPQMGSVQCWMNPIMRKTKMPPDSFMRRQLYSLLKPADMFTKQVNVIGNNLALRKSSGLYNILEKNGFDIKNVCTCRDFREHETMASSKLSLVTDPLGRSVAKELCGRLGQEWIYLPVSYDWEQIREHWKCLSDLLELDFDSAWEEIEMDQLWQKAETAPETLTGELARWSVAIDYTASSRPFGMAKLLVKCGFRVECIYADAISPEEEDIFAWLKKQCPRMLLYPMVYHKMAVLPRTWCREAGGKVLAIGQKAAYFAGTSHFVDMVEGGGLYGYGGILELAAMMEEAAGEEKDTGRLIQVKGWGCRC